MLNGEVDKRMLNGEKFENQLSENNVDFQTFIDAASSVTNGTLMPGGIRSRDDRILKRRFHAFLLPSVLSMLAVSLNEFLDSIVVAKLLGADAMTLVNIGSPVMMVFSTIYTLFGAGGAIAYAKQIGDLNRRKAGAFFSLSMAAGLALALAVFAVGLLFLQSFAGILCREEAMLPAFIPYLRVLFISAPFIILLQLLIFFLPPSGGANLATGLNIIANGVNVILDYIYIHFFHLGVAGAAWATLSGYVIAFAVLIVFLALKKVRIEVSPIQKEAFDDLKQIVSRGAASALGQLGFCIRISFVNNLASAVGGMMAVTAFSVCMQTISLVSIMLAGVLQAFMPILSMLHSQEDWTGIGLMMRHVMRLVTLFDILFTVLFVAFPQGLLFLYEVREPGTAALTITAIRIFSFMFLFRGGYLFFQQYFQVVGRKAYAVVISLIDGFVGICPLAYVMAMVFGLNGLWLSFPLLSALLLIGVLIVNMRIVKRSGGKYRGFYLLKQADADEISFEQTLSGDRDTITGFSEEIFKNCLKHNMDEKKANIIALSCEEIGIYTADQNEKQNRREQLLIDLMIRIRKSEAVMIFRSEGLPFDWMKAADEAYSNIWMLKKIADKSEYDYVMGMNQTRISIML